MTPQMAHIGYIYDFGISRVNLNRVALAISDLPFNGLQYVPFSSVIPPPIWPHLSAVY